jgi:large subunit ribosomal protein L23
MSKEEEKNQEVVQRIDILDGTINVPANQKLRHLTMKKKEILSVFNDKFHDIVKDPVISEKSMDLADQGWYTFNVDKNATKHQIIHALEVMFKIGVVDVHTVRSGTQTAFWNRKKKKKEIKKEISKKAMVKFNPDVDLNMDKIQELMANREKIMGR